MGEFWAVPPATAPHLPSDAEIAESINESRNFRRLLSLSINKLECMHALLEEIGRECLHSSFVVSLKKRLAHSGYDAFAVYAGSKKNQESGKRREILEKIERFVMFVDLEELLRSLDFDR